MKNYYRRYLLLAITGAAIIGLAFYLLLNSYLDRERIIVAARNIMAGTQITNEDLSYMEFYKNSLPEDYLSSGERLLGNTIGIERRKGDFITIDMFDQAIKDNDALNALNKGDVMIAVEIQHPEPILEKLKNGDIVSIVSTIRDKNLLQGNLKPGSVDINNEISNYSYEFNDVEYLSRTYLEMNTFNLSENIVSIDGQIIIRNLEIVNLQKDINESNRGILINNEVDSMNVYFKCGLEEAPIIARLTADSKYKIIFEKL